MSLEERPAVVPETGFEAGRRIVTGVWEAVMVAGREPSPL
jgi:hypothetical protein